MREPGRVGLQKVRLRQGLCPRMHLPNKHRATSQRERRRFLFHDVSSEVFNLFLAACLLEIIDR
jgi:hypothetical protein